MTTEPIKSTQPKKPRAKKLSLKVLEKNYNEINTYSTHVIDEKQNITIKYYRIFDNAKIELLIKEASVNLEYDTQNKIGFFKEDERMIQYLLFLTIRYFTELYNEIPATLEEQLPIFNQLISTGVFEEIINNAFDPNETGRVIERFTSFISLVSQVAELESETRLRASESVQHPLMKKKLEEGKPDA